MVMSFQLTDRQRELRSKSRQIAQDVLRDVKAMAECLPYYTELFDQMKATKAEAHPHLAAVVAPAVAE